MVEKGMILVCGDPDLEDEYLVRLAENARDIRFPFPVVTVLRILSYPIQHAIVWRDVLKENCPFLEGARCRLKFLRTPETRDMATLGESYADCMSAAIWAMQKKAAAAGRSDILGILARHAAGQFPRNNPRLMKRWLKV